MSRARCITSYFFHFSRYSDGNHFGLLLLQIGVMLRRVVNLQTPALILTAALLMLNLRFETV